MATVKTIKPGGGGDYTNLSSWAAFATVQASADQWAECYTGNLGKMAIISFTATPDSTHYPRIYSAQGQRHNGISATSGAYIGIGDSDSYGLDIENVDYFRVEGIAINMTGGIVLPTNGLLIRDCTNVTVDGMLINNTSIAGIDLEAQTKNCTYTLKNSIVKGSQGDSNYIFGVAPGFA